jgi:hypothetical protein
MTEMQAFKDVHTGLLDGLKRDVAGLADPPGKLDWHVGSSTPAAAGVEERGLFVVVEMRGGTDDFFTDHPVVFFEVLGRSRAETYATSEAIRAWLLALPVLPGPVVIDNATTRTRPQQLPSEGMRRWGASYELSVRR